MKKILALCLTIAMIAALFTGCAGTTVVIGEPYYPQVAGRKGTSEEYHAIAEDLMVRIAKLGEAVK